MRTTITDIDPRDVPGIPPIAAAVAAAEVEAVVIMRAAGEEQIQAIRSETHDRSGSLDKSLVVRTRKIPGGGVSMSFGPLKAVAFATRKGNLGHQNKPQRAFYADFIDRGTGLLGPKGRRIQNPGLIRVGSSVKAPSGRGQAPQRIFQRANAHYVSTVAPATDELVEAALTRRIRAVSS